MRKVAHYTLTLLLTCLALGAASAQLTAEEYIEKALAKADAGEFQYAATLADEAIARDSTVVKYYYIRAGIEKELSDDLSPLEYYGKALELDTTNASTFNEIGLFLGYRGKVDDAVALFGYAIQYAASDSARLSYITNRGAVRKVINDQEGAMADFRLVLDEDPEHVAALNNLAASYGEQGFLAESAVTLEQLSRVVKTDKMRKIVAINLGMTYTQLDSLDLALRWFDIAHKYDPEQPLLLSNRADALRRLQRYPEALESINASIALYPENSWAYYNLARIYFDQGLTEEGCRALGFAEHYGFAVTYGEDAGALGEAQGCGD